MGVFIIINVNVKKKDCGKFAAHNEMKWLKALMWRKLGKQIT